MSTNSISLPDVAETGLLTFYCHVIESQNPNPILQDEKAVEISRQLNPVLENSSSKLLRNLAKGKVNKTNLWCISPCVRKNMTNMPSRFSKKS